MYNVWMIIDVFFIHLHFDKYIQLNFRHVHHSNNGPVPNNSSLTGPTSAPDGALCHMHYWVQICPSLYSSKENHHATAILHHHPPYILRSKSSS